MIEELRAQLAAAHQHVTVAESAGREHEAQLHRSRIDDLIEIAMRHGIDLKPWPDQPHLQAR
ncbi:hypothetical protein GCM10023321_14980 [Pseudonocardia eucalypti]|uniref:Uncharacterized protein n=1 Tax=Pseudonocardia eucalypti TaxID=648755 RepID=A0ABP9PUP5_9PSEU|nr:hypothetical protein [Pseudonocardia eucalypti]